MRLFDRGFGHGVGRSVSTCESDIANAMSRAGSNALAIPFLAIPR
jgi:hypothetical protein